MKISQSARPRNRSSRSSRSLPCGSSKAADVRETGGGIVFLRKVAPGAADRSYGIEVAKLAGLPAEVVERAREVLAEHENTEHGMAAHLSSPPVAQGGAERPSKVQLTMFTPLSEQIVSQLRDADLNRLTPLEAMNLLAELKKQI